MGNETFYHALKINSEVCTGCTHCMNVCPTAAIRIKYGKATINEAACTDCGMCLKTCPRQAIYVEQDDFNQIFKFSYRIILLPSVFIGQFPEDISEEQIFSELHNLGFMSVDRKEDFVIDKIHIDHPVYRRTFFADGTLDGCDFSGTLGDIKNTDLFFRYAFVDVFFPDINGCNIHGLF